MLRRSFCIRLRATARPSRTTQTTLTSKRGLRRWYLSCTPDFDESTRIGLPLHSTMLSTSAAFIRWWCAMCARAALERARPASRTSSRSGPRCSGRSSRRAYAVGALAMSVWSVVTR